VNNDLISRGVIFLQTADGKELFPLSDLNPDDVVIIPAFGTTPEIVEDLRLRGIDPATYNATCPFVEKVWKRGRQIGEQGFSVVIHGKHSHEETRATFSQVRPAAPSVVIRDYDEAQLLTRYIIGELPPERFYEDFKGRFSEGFDVIQDLRRVGVINQTTMLAEDTREIALLIKESLRKRFGSDDLPKHYADTRDTLCYATSENQRAMKALLECDADIAVIVGGYNSSNTSHLVELCHGRLPAFYVKDAEEIISRKSIRHLDLEKGIIETAHWLPTKGSVRVLVSAGASCPDAMVEAVIERIADVYPVS
jgi:4-hydroxy-3-methylbut-2-enyl diphosphate reductase